LVKPPTLAEHGDDNWRQLHEQRVADELLEVVEEGSGGASTASTETRSALTRTRERMRFWAPSTDVTGTASASGFAARLTASESRLTARLTATIVPQTDTIAVASSPSLVALFTPAAVYIYQHDGFPVKRHVGRVPVKEGFVISGGWLIDSRVYVSCSARRSGSSTSVWLMSTSVGGGGGGEWTTITSTSSCILLVSRLATTTGLLLLVTAHSVLALDHHPTTVDIADTVTCCSLSPRKSFLVLGGASGDLHLLDLRSLLLVNRVSLESHSSVSGVDVHGEWSERCEHRRARAWVTDTTTNCVRLVDVVSGEVVRRVVVAEGRVSLVRSSLGAPWILYACSGDGDGDGTVVYYHDYRAGRRVALVRCAAGVGEVAVVEGGGVVVVGPGRSVFVSL
jgi:WD40 repeat protein